MNKNQFRIIFNKTRGLMMAVAECVKSHGSGRKAGSSNLVSPELNSINQLPQTATIRPVIFSVMLSLGLVGMVPDVLADVIADPGAPVNQRPIILTAPIMYRWSIFKPLPLPGFHTIRTSSSM